jgi:hypothetical protein
MEAKEGCNNKVFASSNGSVLTKFLIPKNMFHGVFLTG